MQPIPPNTTLTWQFPASALMIPIAICLVAVVLGLICLRFKAARKVSFIFFGIALIAGGVYAPSMAGDRVVVAPKEFSVTTGLWYARTHLGFVYDTVRLVRLRTENHKPSWLVEFKDGHSETLVATTVWKDNYQNIMDALQRHGISFRNDLSIY